MRDPQFERKVRARLDTLNVFVRGARAAGGNPLRTSPAGAVAASPVAPLALALLDTIGADIDGRNWEIAARLIRHTLRLSSHDAEPIASTRVTREGLARLLAFLEPRAEAADPRNWARAILDHLRQPAKDGESVVDTVNIASLRQLETSLDRGDKLGTVLAREATPAFSQPQPGGSKAMDRIEQLEEKLKRLEALVAALAERIAEQLDATPPRPNRSRSR